MTCRNPSDHITLNLQEDELEALNPKTYENTELQTLNPNPKPQILLAGGALAAIIMTPVDVVNTLHPTPYTLLNPEP